MAITGRDFIKMGLILLTGIITPILHFFVPVAGGGVSLIFVITVPLTFGISMILLTIYFFLLRKEKHLLKNQFFYSGTILNLAITFLMYPYS